MDLINQFFFSFGIFSIFALFGGLISARWRQPAIVGFLLVGAIVGPNMLGLINDNEVIELLAEFGAALLLFSIGLEFSLSRLLGSSIRAMIVASGIMFVLFIAGYEAGIFLGLGYFESVIVGACFSFSSTAVFVRNLNHHKLLDSPQVPLLISVLVLEDIVAVTVLTIFSSIKNESLGSLPSLNSVLLPIFFSLIIMGFVYLVLKRLLEGFVKVFSPYLTDEYVILLALGLTVLLSLLSAVIGLAPSIGAFISGSILASLSIRNAVEKSMSPFSLAFSSYFFLSLGLLISPANFFAYFFPILGLSILFAAAAFTITTIMVYFAGFNFKHALVSGVSFAVISEFSLLLAKETAPLMPNFDLISILSVMILITTFISSILLAARQGLFMYLTRFQSIRIFSAIPAMQKYVGDIICEFEGRGQYMLQARTIFVSSLQYTKNFVVLGAFLFVFLKIFGNISVVLFGLYLHISYIILLIISLLFLPTVVQILMQFSLLANAIVVVFTRTHPGDTTTGWRLLRNAVLFIFFLACFLLLPPFFSILKLPSELSPIIFIPLFGMLVLLWDSASAFITKFSSIRKRHY
ncbi:MAG: cation:proton antiporter [Candidatus Micrarchaeia archaeon]